MWLHPITISVHCILGDYPKARSFCEQALKIRQHSLPSNHPDTATSYSNIAVVYSKLHDYSKALSFYEEGLKILLQSLPSNHPGVALFYQNIGTLYIDMGDYPNAYFFCKDALEVAEQAPISEHHHLQRYKILLEDIQAATRSSFPS